MEAMEINGPKIEKAKRKSKLVAIILWIFLGEVSAHNIYLGKLKKGLSLCLFYYVIRGTLTIFYMNSGNVSIFNLFFSSIPVIGLIIDPIIVMITQNKLVGLFGLICCLGILFNMIFELTEILQDKYKDDNNQNVFSATEDFKEEPKKKGKALVLCILGIGSFIHDLYLGRIKRTFVICGISFIYTFILNIVYFTLSGIKGYTGLNNILEVYKNNSGLKTIGIAGTIIGFLIIIYWLYEFISIIKGKIKDDNGNYVFLASAQSKIKEDIVYIRGDVGIIDSKILYLLKDRMEKVEKIGKLKKSVNLDIYDPAQEEKVKARYKEHAKSLELNEEFTDKICDLILEESKRVQEQQK